MGVKVNYSHTATTNELKALALDTMKNVVSNIAHYVGEEAVEEARLHGSYTDRTGNLRSSIGYSVVMDGTVQNGQFRQFGAGAEGQAEAKEALSELSKKREGDVDLHIVAGMDYADYVERHHNRVVLSSARTLADNELPTMLRSAGIKFKKKS